MKITNRNMTVLVHREPCEKDPIFAVNVEAACEAIEILSEDAYNLWCYLAKNPESHTVKLSLDDVAKRGFKESSFYKSMDELTKLGYISDLGRDVFIFYDNRSFNF